MARYKLAVDRRVTKKDLTGLPNKDVARIMQRIAGLATEPRPLGTEKLTNRPGYRLRQGPYRLLYEIDDQEKTVTIRAVAHRREAYR